MTVEYFVKKLDLMPHPEGGFYKETYRSEGRITTDNKSVFPDGRHFATSIYFLIDKNNFSALHKIRSDESWHFYSGDALEVIEIDEDGNLINTTIGADLERGEVFQYTVKANRWFGSRVKKGGNFSLVGCTVSPGFDFADFEMGERVILLAIFPKHREVIEELTR